MGKFFYKIFYLLFLAALYSCGRLSADDSQPLIPIDFSVRDYTAEVKGISLTTDNISSFGVFAALEENSQDGFSDVDASELQPFMDNVPVTKDASGRWTANPPHYWPVLKDKSLSFFAYAPHSEYVVAAAGWEDDALQPDKIVRLAYSMDQDPTNQIDLCVARTVLDRSSFTHSDSDGVPDPVTFSFEHVLSMVSFAANYTGTLPDGCNLIIEEVSLENLSTSGVLLLNASQTESFYSWENLSATTDINLSITGETLANDVFIDKADPNQSNRNYVDFVTGKGDIFILPQTVNPEPEGAQNIQDEDDLASLSVVFSYVMTDNSGKLVVTAQFYTEMPLPTSALMVSKKTVYAFTIDVTSASLINLSAVTGSRWIDDWEEGVIITYPGPVK